MSVPAPTPNKTRSPNYPSIGLGEAIQKIKTIYSKQRQYSATRDVLAKTLGYGGVNGASATLISALSKYGLIEGYGDKLKVSDIGRDLALHQRGDAEYADALRAAAFMPTFFQELRQQYPEGLPESEHIVRAWLTKRGFSDKAIDSAVRAYRDTMEFVEAEIGGVNATNPTAQNDEAAMQTQHEGHKNKVERPLAPPPSDPRQKTIQLPVSLDEWATLQAAFPLSESAWDQMMAVLVAMKPGLVAPPEPAKSREPRLSLIASNEENDEPGE